eukprot:TRINITY_DN12588_c0_g1_i1.p1 TRINITY_DN12588_c0_g1~~TRINITY_DN12588_c0_g1_i1.p1  ORF type:complete len:306 (+),score=91.51 TRINITY_DN12588_c0_g1_i1:88-918(+)
MPLPSLSPSHPRRRDGVPPGWWLLLFGAATTTVIFLFRTGVLGGAPLAADRLISGAAAVLVCAGGQTPDGPTPHVLLRLQRALQLWKQAPDGEKPYVITTAWGTVHKPCPHDRAGFEVHEAEMNARWLLRNGVPAEYLLEEQASLETIGNAYFARLLHCEPLRIRRITVVNNRWHMPRTRAVFEHVFGLPGPDGTPSGYVLTFDAVGDGLPGDVLQSRLRKEEEALPRFAEGSEWRQKTQTMAALHRWMFRENTAYAAKRLGTERQPIDPKLAASY